MDTRRHMLGTWSLDGRKTSVSGRRYMVPEGGGFRFVKTCMGMQETKSSTRDEKRIAGSCVLDGGKTLIGGRRYMVSKVSGVT